MSKQVLSTNLILFALVLSMTTGQCFADASALLQQADTYKQQGNYEQAEAIYKQIVTDYPGTDYAFEAQKRLTIVYILWGKKLQADAAFQELVTNFSKNEHIAQAVCEIAHSYRSSKEYKKANKLYQYVVDNWPDAEHAMWSQMGVVLSNIGLGNDANAQTALDKLLTDFSGNEQIAKAVHEIAGHYRWLKKYEKSKQLCQHVIDNFPGSEQAMWSQMGVAIANISLGESNAAAAAIDKLVADFSGNEHIAQAVGEIAGHCNFLEKHEKARELHQYVLENFPRSEQAMWSQMGIAVSNAALGETGAAQAAVDKLLADFSRNGQIADAVRQVANAHRKSGKYEKASELYKYVLDHWPRDESAVLARMDMALSNISSLIHDGNDSEALTVLDKLIADFNDHPALPKAISYIEEEYYNKILAAETWARENYLHPVEIWAKVLSKFPDFFYDDPDLYYFIACCYYQLGEYGDAINHYIIVTDTWPNCRYVEGAQHLMDECFEKLANAVK